ncbi:MAG TPA: hypothetical protein VJV77_15270 [Casimicrobiaceae bacterium]|nr:hypothetical protein [Casimicrobiaceae bacterium]
MRVAAAFCTWVAGAALACVIAYFGWRIFGPSPTHLPIAGPVNPAAALVAANLFGGAGTSAAPQGAILGNDARLLGIIAEPGQRGYALFRLASGPKLVEQGQEISSGVTVTAVHADAVTIRDGAGERRFELRSGANSRSANAAPQVASRSGPPAVQQGASRMATSAPTRATATRTATGATCGPPAGFGGAVVRLNTELMGGLGADSVQWNTLLTPVEGGLLVREGNGFAGMLGLRAGDRLAQANGIALGAPEDVGTAIVRPLVANQGVRLIGSRNGLTQELWLANAACAG